MTNKRTKSLITGFPSIRNAGSVSLMKFDRCDISLEKEQVQLKNNDPGNQNVLQKLKRPLLIAILSTVLLVPIFLSISSNAVETGGRIGGSYAPSQSRSRNGATPIAPSSSYSYGRGFSSGYGAGVLDSPFFRPMWPSYGWGWGWGWPSFGWSPWFGGGVTVMTPVSPIFGFTIFALVIIMFFSMSSSFMNSISFGSSLLSSGSGYSVVDLNFALDVPFRDDPQSILSKLNRISKMEHSESKRGMENIVHDVAVELLRKKDSIFAGSTQYMHFSSEVGAKKDFGQKAASERSKYQRETVSVYRGIDYSDEGSDIAILPGTKSTTAVITLLLLLEGEAKIPKIRNANDVQDALTRIAGEVKAGDCLISAEVLWVPEARSESLSRKDVIADYPKLTNI